MGSSKAREDQTPTASTDSTPQADSDRLAGLKHTQGRTGDARLPGSQGEGGGSTATEGVGELEQTIPRLANAEKNIWGTGNRGADNNVLRGTRRPLVRLAALLADGHYFLLHKTLKTPRLDYIRRSLVASLQVSYGLVYELERQIDVTRKKSSKYAAADDVVPKRARTYRASRRNHSPKPRSPHQRL